MENIKATNPKGVIGQTKIPFHLWPATATLLGALGMMDGAGKYGRSNYRAAPVLASVYLSAGLRHQISWFEGENVAPDSRLHHLGHALCCLAILVDAEAHGTLID